MTNHTTLRDGTALQNNGTALQNNGTALQNNDITI